MWDSKCVSGADVVTHSPSSGFKLTIYYCYGTYITNFSILIFLLFANSWELSRLQRVIHNQIISGWLSFLVFNWEVNFVDLVHSAWVFNQILYCGFEVCLTGPERIWDFSLLLLLHYVQYITLLTVLLLFCNYNI